MSFAERLKELIGQESVSGFARRVELSEALIRKYLKGSEPSLAKANQIAMKVTPSPIANSSSPINIYVLPRKVMGI